MKRCLVTSFRYFSTITSSVVPKVAIVGSGPAGFYTAQQLIKVNQNVIVDIYDRLPVPFGLVRYGVAPDHPEVKNVINTFTKTAKNPRVQFIGNVKLGKDVFLKDLKKAYHAVILAYGADKDNEFGIPGEDKSNVISARRFVGWYNGLPEDSHLKPDLTCNTVAVLGQGNVAIDVARILLMPINELKKTDITEHALSALSNSKVKKVHLIGRRGPLQVAFTIKEFREMLRVENVKTVFSHDQMNGIEEYIPKLVRPRKRLTQLLVEAASKFKEDDVQSDKLFHPLFLRSPVCFLGSNHVSGVKLSINSLEGADVNFEKQKAKSTGMFEELNCGMVLRSIGYQSTKADPDVPFNDNNCTVSSAPGVYSAGWLSTGPVGVILSTMTNAFETGICVAKDISENIIDLSKSKPGFEEINKILAKKGVQTVSFSDWERIDKVEIEDGKRVGKPREKIIDIKKMLNIADGHC